MRSITGNPVDGDDFWGRHDELKQLIDDLQAGNHVLLVGPRRVGKSSIVAEVVRRLTGNGWTAITVDVQHTADEAAFLQEIHEAIRSTELKLPLIDKAHQAIQSFSQFFRGTKVSVAGTSVELKDQAGNWESAASSLKSLIGTLPENDRRVLIAVDELPIFLTKLLALENGATRVRAILDWLRSVRVASKRRLPWILCGSIGLDSFVAKHGLEGSINELLPQTVDAFEVEQAMGLLVQLGNREESACPVSKDLAAYMVEKVGWPIPYYLQLLFHGLKNLPAAKRLPHYPSREDVDAAYESLLGPQRSTHFGHWDTRLGDLLDANEQPKARLLLKELAAHPTGRSREQLRAVLAKAHPQADPQAWQRELADLLEFLQRDGYLGQSGEQFAFRSFLLRDYWQRKFGS